MYDDDFEDDEGAAIGAPMMVEVKGHNRTPRQHSQRSLHRESDEDEEDRSLYTIKPVLKGHCSDIEKVAL
jgi:hypothetical protein